MPFQHGDPNLKFNKADKKTKSVKLYLQGYSQQQIADMIGCSRPSVEVYLREAREEWKNDRLESMDEIVDMELAKLDQMEQDSTALFEKFFDPEATRGDDKYLNSKEATEWVKNRLKILEMKHKILGVYKPVKVETKSEVTLSADQTEEIRSTLLSRLAPKNDNIERSEEN